VRVFESTELENLKQQVNIKFC